MLILKDFKLVKKETPIQKFEELYCGDVKIGHVTKNIFGIATQTGTVNYPTVKPYMFQFDIGLGGNVKPIIYGFTVEDCRNEAIEIFREFLQSFLK